MTLPPGAADLPTGPGARVHIVRDFDARPERIWKAWIDPALLVRWLGPREWPADEVHADLRVGGAWRARLQSVDGQPPLQQSGTYVEIDPPRRLVFTFRWDSDHHEDGPGVETLVTLLLSELAPGRTRMEFTQVGLASDQSASGHEYGWRSTFDRLADDLGSQP